MVKFALIGCGNIGLRHAKLMQESGKLIAVVDIESKRKSDFSKQFDVPGFSSIEEMVRSVPEAPAVIAVCTPNYLHAAHSIQALQSGMHVICEKPMALTTIDCEKMISAAEKADRKLFIVKQNRFNPPVEILKKLVEDGLLGRIHSIQMNCFWNRENSYYENSWRGDRQKAGGTLFTQFSHFIDLLVWLFGEARVVAKEISSAKPRQNSSLDDQGIIMLEFAGKISCGLHYTINAFKQNMEGSITVFGDCGTIKVGGPYLNLMEYQSLNEIVLPDLIPSGPPNQYGSYTGSMSNHDKIYSNVVSVIEGKSGIFASGIEGLKTVELIQEIYANTGWDSRG